MAFILDLLLILSLLALVPITALGERTTHLHFYMHDIANTTAVQVIKGIPQSDFPGAYFGNTVVIDDPLTEGPGLSSKLVGRAQGFYCLTSLKAFALLVNMNIVLSDGAYNGSTLAIFGRNDVLLPVRELSVIGGSGKFRMARGYVLWKTYSTNSTTGDFTLELDVHASV